MKRPFSSHVASGWIGTIIPDQPVIPVLCDLVLRHMFRCCCGHCASALGCKQLWLEGLAELRGELPPREAAELLEVAGDKGVLLRTEVMEAMLQQLAEQQ